MKSLALLVFGSLALVAWFFEIELLRNLLIFGAIGLLVVQYEKVFDVIFSSGTKKTEPSEKSHERISASSGRKSKNGPYWQGADIKNCASCQYWSGERKTDSSRVGLRFDQFENANCVGGGRDKVAVSAVQICQQYAKMAGLK